MEAHKYPDRFYTDPGAIRCLCNDCKHFHGRRKCDWYNEIPDDLLFRRPTDSQDCGNGHHFEPKEENESTM